MRVAMLVALVCLGGTSASAQSVAAADTGRRADATTRSVLRLEDQWASALVRRDGATFERLLAPGFVYTENDHVSGRADVLHDIVAGSDTVTAAHNESMQVHRFGVTTVVVTGWLIVQGRGAAGPFDHRYRFTDTWVRQRSRWQIVAAHDYIKG